MGPLGGNDDGLYCELSCEVNDFHVEYSDFIRRRFVLMFPSETLGSKSHHSHGCLSRLPVTKEELMRYQGSLRFSSMAIAVVWLALASTSPTVGQTYTVTNIGTLGGTDSVALSINDFGEVVGYSKT